MARDLRESSLTPSSMMAVRAQIIYITIALSIIAFSIFDTGHILMLPSEALISQSLDHTGGHTKTHMSV